MKLIKRVIKGGRGREKEWETERETERDSKGESVLIK